MSASLVHRGPDDEGFAFCGIGGGVCETYSSQRSPAAIKSAWPDLSTASAVGAHHVGLAQVRYSIIDPGSGGHQPMWSACGNVCLTFNGEIYNYVELRDELRGLGFEFRTRSDTEVLLVAYLAWGDRVFAKLNGFFALALYDVRRRAVLLARDRIGKAHLYFHRASDGSVVWASEIKALLAGGWIGNDCLDSLAVADFILFNRRDRGGTFWEQADDFPPGHFAWIRAGEAFSPTRYWSLPEARLGVHDLSPDEAAAGLRGLLVDALRLRLRADVPIGFELSGGMDSSALVGLAAGCLGARFTAYTVAFEEAHADEQAFAQAVARRYPNNIDHRVVTPPREQFWEEADRFVWEQEEPFHAPNLHTNQLLRRTLKAEGAHVVISGSAGDELLAGYAGDYLAPFLRYLLSKGDIRRFISEIRCNSEIPAGRAVKGLLADAVLTEERRALYGKRRVGELAVLRDILTEDVLGVQARRSTPRSEMAFHARMVANMAGRKMNYWLRSGAKSNYGIPIEARSPFLDYRVVEYCCQLPPEYLIRGGWHKYVLRLAVRDLLPEEVVWRRRKMGFPFPWAEWLTASKRIVEKNIADIECPYIRSGALMNRYEQLAAVAPVTLWRLLSVLLWWRRVIEGREIHAE